MVLVIACGAAIIISTTAGGLARGFITLGFPLQENKKEATKKTSKKIKGGWRWNIKHIKAESSMHGYL
jgi:hypothetical protein